MWVGKERRGEIKGWGRDVKGKARGRHEDQSLRLRLTTCVCARVCVFMCVSSVVPFNTAAPCFHSRQQQQEKKKTTGEKKQPDTTEALVTLVHTSNPKYLLLWGFVDSLGLKMSTLYFSLLFFYYQITGSLPVVEQSSVLCSCCWISSHLEEQLLLSNVFLST